MAPAKKKSSPQKTLRTPLSGRLRGRLGRVFASIIKIVLILACLPPVFMLIYAIPGARPVSMPIFARAITGQTAERQWAPIDRVAPVMMHSVIMSEDGRFCAHNGVDWEALNSVIDDALEGEATRGASTIPMQTMKNLFLWPHRSFIRKGLEIPLALLADALWSKRRMLEIYLNIAEWDEGIYGIAAASSHYFSTTPDKLTRLQAALLTVALPAPKTRNPAKPTRSLARLAARVESRARKAGAYVKCLSPDPSG